MDTDSPFEGDTPDDGDVPSYEWLDEWLCEYVDGTMDPSLEAVFEKYVEANPELKAHIERLQKTRELLCNCGLPTDASSDVEDEVCREVACDVPRAKEVEEDKRVQGRPLAAFGRVSSVVAALIVGFFVGAMVVGPLPSVDQAGVDSSNRIADDPGSSTLDQVQGTPAPRPDAQRPPTPFVARDSADASTLTPVGMP